MIDCRQARSMFSPYLDGAVSGQQMHSIALHLDGCPDCAQIYRSLERTQAMLASLGTVRPPAELALRLKVAVQQERSRSARRTLQSMALRFEHALNTFMLPATAGLVTAVVMFGVLIGCFAMPQIGDDVPTLLYTPPKLANGPYVIQGLEAPVLIEAAVDADGRVQDYRILSGPHDSDSLRVKIDNALIFTTFEPARAFGQPASGHVVLAFASVNVKG
jgi:anti-sigma factor RsiW